jgi:hypothetical protein
MTTPSATPSATRSDAAPIDWDNVVVETNVMMKLQDVKPPVDKKAKPSTKKGPG